ncbi:LacI family DNA-binding transcriptional regulator [Cellulomonas fengjieae]|uniref:LacI family DNA-binding transcriptional regulator n=1 Tax=Cellulomonas fengjieae TaxID=2819978 RepID=A0ABS3SDB2_9CELL|nr:LacI family DNA-binding transcriptional regulator [Cellulomonas fengjieae]MBO3083733.1 LacI family DNA-binding transcriptional regulator [Cellulomonas fengjieae]QVI67949.1 LacI family DNA-binding transcriptional regulator [Cellulomonas fengjieae]
MVDVARLAGVSHVTVSRVVNGHPSVSADTRARVEAAIAELGYRRNSMARALKSGSSSTIGVVIAGSELYELPRLLLGLETAARRAGYWVSLASWMDGAGDLAETVQRLADQSVEAVAVVADRPVAVDALATITSRIPLSVVMSGDVPNPRVASVEVDQDLGAGLVVRHLAGLGHREIVHLSGALRTWDARARVEGWRAELEATPGLSGDLLEGDFTAESGYRLAHELVSRPGGPPGAVFAGNDQMAMGVLAAFAERGVSVPGDVSLVGFDDQVGSGYLVPALTTVRQDFAALGEAAIESLLAALRGDVVGHRKLEPELVVRRSTAPPR